MRTPQNKSPLASGSQTLLLNQANNLTVTPLDGFLPQGWKSLQDFWGWSGLAVPAERGPAELRSRGRCTALGTASY